MTWRAFASDDAVVPVGGGADARLLLPVDLLFTAFLNGAAGAGILDGNAVVTQWCVKGHSCQLLFLLSKHGLLASGRTRYVCYSSTNNIAATSV